MSDQLFAKVFAEFDGKLTREELKVYQDKFNEFDINGKNGEKKKNLIFFFLNKGDNHIDIQELKKAQEKLGRAMTHQEVMTLMEAMATDPKLGITFRDFVVFQLLGKGIDVRSQEEGGGYGGDIPDVISTFVAAVEDYSVKSIKNFYEEKMRLAKLEKEREEMLKKGKGDDAKRKQKEKEELERMKREEEEKKAEEERKREAFKNKFAMFDKK